MSVSAMKACFRIAERRTIFCKDTLKICNFQIFRQFLQWWIEKNKSIATPCRICAFSLNTLMLWRVACLKLE